MSSTKITHTQTAHIQHCSTSLSFESSSNSGNTLETKKKLPTASGAVECDCNGEHFSSQMDGVLVAVEVKCCVLATSFAESACWAACHHAFTSPATRCQGTKQTSCIFKCSFHPRSNWRARYLQLWPKRCMNPSCTSPTKKRRNPNPNEKTLLGKRNNNNPEIC